MEKKKKSAVRDREEFREGDAVCATVAVTEIPRTALDSEDETC